MLAPEPSDPGTNRNTYRFSTTRRELREKGTLTCERARGDAEMLLEPEENSRPRNKAIKERNTTHVSSTYVGTRGFTMKSYWMKTRERPKY